MRVSRNDFFGCPNLKFSAPPRRALSICGECIQTLFTTETQRSQRLRREKLKLGHYSFLSIVLVSRKGTKKENTEAQKNRTHCFAPLALQFLAPLRETKGRP